MMTVCYILTLAMILSLFLLLLLPFGTCDTTTKHDWIRRSKTVTKQKRKLQLLQQQNGTRHSLPSLPEEEVYMEPETCQTTPSSDWIRTNVSDPQYFRSYRHSSDFLQGPGLINQSSLTHAVCEFREMSWYFHFPHAFQQLFRCWSWWEAHDHLPSILLWKGINFRNLVTDTFMHFIETYRPVKVIHEYTEEYISQSVHSKKTGLHPNDIEITDFALLHPQHAHQLRELFHLHLNNGQPMEILPSGCRHDKRQPRIGILNRELSRQIINENELIEAIQTKYPNYEIQVTNFDYGRSIEYQARFMMETDILLTPHGAGEFNIVFMPSFRECSSMIEFMPPYYIVPDFFASLAKAVHIQHSYFYMKIHDHDRFDDHNYHNLMTFHHRDNSMCLNIPKVIDALSTLIEEWLQCCRDKLSFESLTT